MIVRIFLSMLVFFAASALSETNATVPPERPSDAEIERAYLYSVGRSPNQQELDSGAELLLKYPVTQIFVVKREGLRHWLYEVQTPANRIRLLNRACRAATGNDCSAERVNQAVTQRLLFQEVLTEFRNEFYGTPPAEAARLSAIGQGYQDALGRAPNQAELTATINGRRLYREIVDLLVDRIYSQATSRLVIERAYAFVKGGDLLPTEVFEQVNPMMLSYKDLVELFHFGNYRNQPHPATKVGIFIPFIARTPTIVVTVPPASGTPNSPPGTVTVPPEDLSAPYIDRATQIGSFALRMDGPVHPPPPATGGAVLDQWAPHIRSAKAKGQKVLLIAAQFPGDYDDPCDPTIYHFFATPPSPLPTTKCNFMQWGDLKLSRLSPAKYVAWVKRFLELERPDYIEIGNELNIAEFNGDLNPNTVPGPVDANRFVVAYYRLLRALKAELPTGHPPLIFNGHAGCETYSSWDENENNLVTSPRRTGCLSFNDIADAVERLNTASCANCADHFWSLVDGVANHAYISATGAKSARYAASPTPTLYREIFEQMRGQSDYFLAHSANMSARSRNKPVYVTELGVEMHPTAPGLSTTILRYVLGGLAQLGRQPAFVNGRLRFDPNALRVPVPLITYYSTQQVHWAPSNNPDWLKYVFLQNDVWQPAKSLVREFNNPQ